MAAFVPAVLAKIPSFAGVKFVDNDAGDFFSVVGTYGDRIGMLWAPEPKLQGILLGARGVILAESFYAPTWLRMCTEISSGNWTAAHLEQQWKFTVDAIFGNYGGTNAKRALYNYTAKIDIGPNRPPQGVPLTPSQYQGLIRDLTAAGFFAQNIPGPCLLPKSW
jgi:dihydrodipicolinate synthase/N-acetylneuraminate lyase